MVAVGMLLGWLSYSGGLFGWCMFRGYNVTLGQLMSPVHPYGSGKNEPWPPAMMPAEQIWPGSVPAAAASGTGTGSTGSPSSSSNDQLGEGSSGGCPPGKYMVGGKCTDFAAA